MLVLILHWVIQVVWVNFRSGGSVRLFESRFGQLDWLSRGKVSLVVSVLEQFGLFSSSLMYRLIVNLEWFHPFAKLLEKRNTSVSQPLFKTSR